MDASGRGIGKVILLGEHAVVHGRPALVAGLSRGVTARVRPSSAEASRLIVPEWNLQAVAGDDTDLGRALAALLAADPDAARLPTLDFMAEPELPGGAGLGLSAAMGVALTRALDAHLGRERSTERLLEQVEAWERIFHLDPSGVDAAMAARGGMALYRRGEPLESIHTREPLWAVVAHSGEPGRTAETVRLVARQLERDPARVEGTFDAMASLVRNAHLALLAGEPRSLGRLLDLAQVLLSSLMVSTPRLETLCQAAREAGALGAKLTGGGGGGCMTALAEDREAASHIAEALRARGADPVFVASLGT